MAKIIIIVDIDDVGAEESVSYSTIVQYLYLIKIEYVYTGARSPSQCFLFSTLY
jgi:hypothetical protein